MTFNELRAAVRTNVNDRFTTMFTNAVVDPLVNLALQHVANWADLQDQALFLTTATVQSIGVGPDDLFVSFGTGTGNFNLLSYRPFRRAVRLERTDHPSAVGGLVTLKLVRAEDAQGHRTGTASETPAYYVTGEGLYLVNPAAGIDLRLTYAYSLPTLANSNDTPGQSNSQGTANALPVEYHGLIAAYATVLALASINADAAQWLAIYAELRDELQRSLTARRGTRSGHAVTGGTS